MSSFVCFSGDFLGSSVFVSSVASAHSSATTGSSNSIFLGSLAITTTLSILVIISYFSSLIPKSETLIISPTFSNFEISTSKESTKFFGRVFTSSSLNNSSIKAPSLAAAESQIKLKGILVVTFSPFVIA